MNDSEWEGALTSHDIEAELAVLGAMMSSPAQAAHCLETLTDGAFYRPAHKIVFAAIGRLAAQGTEADVITVRAELERAGDIDQMGGPGELIRMLEAVPAAANAPHYARKLLDHQARRDSDLLGVRIRQIAAQEDLTPQQRFDAIFAAADEAVAAAVPQRAQAQAVGADQLFWEALNRLEAGQPPGVVELPFADLRSLIPFLRPGQLVSVGARPSIGKSVLALDIARHCGFAQKLPCVLFTLEMDRQEVTDRMIAAEAQVPLKCITDQNLLPRDWDRIRNAAERFAESRLVIDDTSQISLAGIRARLRAMRRTAAAELVIVDYLQLMDGGGGENRQQEVSRLVAGLKGIAREFRIPVVMLFQLNRGPEHRADKRPYLADARESGSIENESDIAILIHREDFYDPTSARRGEADLIVEKNRQGPKTTITVAFQGEYARFYDMAHIAPGWTPSRAAS